MVSECYRTALAGMKVSGPRDLFRQARFLAEETAKAGDVSLTALHDYLSDSTLNDPLRKDFHISVSRWDVV